VGVCDDPDERVLCFYRGGGEDETLFFTLPQLMQESQKLVRRGIRSVVFGPELTADSFAKRAMTGGPFCKLNRRQEHASSPSARSPSGYQRGPHVVGSDLSGLDRVRFCDYCRGHAVTSDVNGPPLACQGWEMASRSFLNDPAHWRDRAEEARTRADQMSDPLCKSAMLRIANDYELLAERAAERAWGRPRKSD
jgi:hypothetical protein